jgi:hypothetical protein
MSAIILPTYLDAASTADSYSSSTPTQLVNGSGLSEAVPDGDTLSHALTVTHVFGGGFTESWVTNDHGSGDYFAAVASPPTIVLDLGSDQPVGTVILWQYQNNGGGAGRTGNHAMTVNVRVNTDAEGTDFTGAPIDETVTVLNVETGLNGVNSAQAFAITGQPTGRYIQLEVTDNYYGQPGISAGGDRVGLGEVRVATEVVPEVSSALLGALGLLGLLRRRR